MPGQPRRAGRAKVQRRSMSVHAAEHIRSLIFAGQLKANQRIPLDELAAEMGVSRLPLREALITLEADGLVASEPHRGTYVVPIRSEDIADHYRLYGMAQGLACSGAARRVTGPVLDRLQELHEGMSASTDPDVQHDLNWEFHSLINLTGASQRTLSVLRQLSHNLPREVYRLAAAASPEATAGHKQMITALHARDGAAADLTSRSHMKLEGDQVVAALQRAGVLDDA